MKLTAKTGLFIILAIYLLMQWPLWDYVTDDTYIHLVYAKNFMQGEGWSFNPGEPSYGSTSPLWVILLAPAAGTETSGLIAARLLGLLAGLASIFIFYTLAGRFIRRESLRTAALLLFATEVWFLRWSASGMESPLVVLILLLVFERVSARPEKRVEFLWLGLLTGLAALVRPEFYLLVLLLPVLAFAHRDWRRGSLAIALGAVLPVAAWLIFAKLHIGSFLPSTASAKVETTGALAETLAHAWRLMRILISSQAVMLLVVALGFLEVLVMTFKGKNVRRKAWSFFGILAAFWSILFIAAMLRGGVAMVSRYLLPVTPLLPLGAFFFLDRWIVRRPSFRILAGGVVLLTLLPNLWLYQSRVLPHAKHFTEDLKGVLGGMADHLRVIAPPGSCVAVPDIGIIGYRSGLRVLDLVGLTQPEISDYWHRHGYDEMLGGLDFLQFGEANYFIDRDQEAGRFVGLEARGRRLVPLMEEKVRGLGIARSDTFTYTLYRIDTLDSAKE
jgi:4-amino-4-deoxy-L-arabinose transferase-like glycosyltransferase